MQMLNRYFTPFALLLIVTAAYFRGLWEEESRGTAYAALAILAADLLVNWWLNKNQYRWAGWANRFRQMQVWFNLGWSIPLFYLLFPYWSPMWLLFVMAPTAAGLTFGIVETILCALCASASMIAVYHSRQPLTGEFLGMALSQAAFIVIFSLFVHGLAQAALRLRDANRA
jgi:hypothetical protein